MFINLLDNKFDKWLSHMTVKMCLYTLLHGIINNIRALMQVCEQEQARLIYKIDKMRLIWITNASWFLNVSAAEASAVLNQKMIWFKTSTHQPIFRYNWKYAPNSYRGNAQWICILTAATISLLVVRNQSFFLRHG